MESGDIVLLLPWLMAYTKRRDSRQRDAAYEASKEAKLKLASFACRQAGGVKVAAHTLLAELRLAGNEETWGMLEAKFASGDHAAVFAAGGHSAVERHQGRG